MDSPFLPLTHPDWGTPADDRQRTRRSSAVKVDHQLLDAAVAVISHVGLDQWTMQSVAKSAGTTTGAVYARYENAAEFSVAVWQYRSRIVLRRLLDDAVQLALSDGEHTAASSDELGAAVHTPSEPLRAALDLLVVARRHEVLAEVVVPDLQSWIVDWGATRSDEPTRRAVVLGTIGTMLGAALGNVPAGAPSADWPRLLRQFAGIGRVPWPVHGRPPEPAFIAHPTIETENFERDRLIAAAAEVVAISGYANATLSRISRRAGGLYWTSYRHFETKAELLTAAIDEVLLRHYMTRIRNSARLFAPDAVNIAQLQHVAAGRVAGNLHPDRRLLESLRLETFLAAAHDADVASALGQTLHAADRAHAETYGKHSTPQRQYDAAHLIRAMPLGVQVVGQLVGPLDDVDWRCFFGPLGRYLTGARRPPLGGAS